MKHPGRVVGLDLGSRRIGVALSDSAQSVATGLKAIQRGGDRTADHDAIKSVVEEYEAVGVVVGLPLSLSGGAGPAARQVLDEVAQLDRVLGVEVDTVDERLTTIAAAGALRAAGRPSRRQKSVVDQTAAAILLQSWIDRQNNLRGMTVD